MAKRSAAESKAKRGTARRGMGTGKKPLRKVNGVVLLSGGNPQIAKADGDAPVQAYLAALPGWKRAAGQRVDEVITRALPTVKKAVKWNSPLYGVEGQGWFLSLHAFSQYLKLTFFKGRALDPMPPGASTQKDVRVLDLREADTLDEALLARWVKQAAAIPGWLV